MSSQMSSVCVCGVCTKDPGAVTSLAMKHSTGCAQTAEWIRWIDPQTPLPPLSLFTWHLLLRLRQQEGRVVPSFIGALPTVPSPSFLHLFSLLLRPFNPSLSQMFFVCARKGFAGGVPRQSRRSLSFTICSYDAISKSDSCCPDAPRGQCVRPVYERGRLRAASS